MHTPPPITGYRHAHSNTTRFNRNPAQFIELVNHVIPATFGGKQHLRILVLAGSVGCEAISLAIALLELAPDLDFEIISTDRQEDVLTFARAAEYSEDYFQPIYGREGGMDQASRNRWFSKRESSNGDLYQPIPQIMSRIRYEHFDLLNSVPFGRFDIVLCQNVLTHMQPQLANTALQRAIQCVGQGGVFLCAGMDLDLRSQIAAEGFVPWTGSIDTIHDGWESHRMHYQHNRGQYYFELEDIDRSRTNWATRYSTIFTRK